MNPIQLNPQELQAFKGNVKEWLALDTQIKELQQKVKELKQKKTKVLEPKITLFMVHNNITDLNTDNGKLKCSEKLTRSGLTSKHIKENLSKVLHDEIIIDRAMEQILNNRTIKKTYQIKKLKK